MARVAVTTGIAGLGGLFPTLSRLATSLAVQPEQPLPHWHIIIALALFFVISAVLNIAFNKENDVAKAIAIGISAPALISNILAGASNAPENKIAQPPYEIRLPRGSESLNFKSIHPDLANISGFRQRYLQNIMIPQEFPCGPGRQGHAVIFRSSLVGPFGFDGTLTTPVKIELRPEGKTWSSFNVAPGNDMRFQWCSAALGDGTSDLRVVVGDAESHVQLHFGSEGSIIVDAKLYVQTTSKGDLVWALGGKRAGTVTRIELVVSKT
jgi:hypothetical protein